MGCAMLKELVREMRQTGRYEIAFWLDQVDTHIEAEDYLSAKIAHESLARECGLTFVIQSGPNWTNVKLGLAELTQYPNQREVKR